MVRTKQEQQRFWSFSFFTFKNTVISKNEISSDRCGTYTYIYIYARPLYALKICTISYKNNNLVEIEELCCVQKY